MWTYDSWAIRPQLKAHRANETNCFFISDGARGTAGNPGAIPAGSV
jgi:hypothetical protein